VQLRQALHSAIAQLEAAAVEESRLHAEVLIFHVLQCDRAHLFAHPERELTTADLSQYEQLIARRAAGEPLQYLTGHQEFWKADFLVTPAVLIPRPETEHLIEEVLALIQLEAQAGNAALPVADARRLKLIDVGTGSGAIAITLARELPQAEVHAVDLSPDALQVARLNAERLVPENMGARVHFAQSDVLASIPRDASFDFVVSNPPYVGRNEADKVQDVVKHYEPPMAVFAGDDGLDVIRRLIPQAWEALRPGGWLLIEIGYTQSESVRALLGGWQAVHTVADLAGIPRVMVARKTIARTPQ
jgi:release factor glutamine methyltransferase